MICVAQRELDKQFQLFIDYSKLNILVYGSIFDIQKYFYSIDIAFEPEETDLHNAGWDYIIGEHSVYFVIDTEWKFTNLLAPIFFFHDETKTVLDLVSYLKRWIRNDKLEKLI